MGEFVRDLIPAVIGLVGVLVGAFASAYATQRAERRRGAVSAARLAEEGLGRWRQALDTRKRPDDGLAGTLDYDVHLALKVHSVRSHLDDSWWSDHASQLPLAATKAEWGVLVAASWATTGLLRIMDRIGDAGNEAVARKVSRIQARADSDSVPADTTRSAAVASDSPSTPTDDSDRIEARAIVA